MKLRNALSFDVRQRLIPIINQMRDGGLPPAARYVPLRQLWTRFPGMTDAERAVAILYVLTKAGGLEAIRAHSEHRAMLLQLCAYGDNLFAQAFANAQEEAVLLLDEADALLGQRTQIADSHGRYATLQTTIPPYFLR